LDMLLDLFAQTWTLTYLIGIFDTVVGSFGFVTNLVSFFIFRDPELTLPMYDYLKIYSLNSSALCLVTIFAFLSTTYRWLSWTNCYWTQAYVLYGYIIVSNTAYFFNTYLDIVITLDRIGNIKNKRWIKLSPYKMCWLGLIACALIEIPYFMQLEISNAVFDVIDLQGRIVHGYTIWYLGNSEFAGSRVGSILIVIVDVVRDVVMMLAEIGVNIVCLYHLKVYLNQRMALTGRSNAQPSTVVTGAATVQQQAEGARVKTASSSEAKAELRMTFMVFCMCVLSVCEHVFVISGTLYANYGSSSQTLYMLLGVSSCSVTFKHAVNFIIFYAFNKNFRKIFLKRVKCN
jgi:hypothetical protein